MQRLALRAMKELHVPDKRLMLRTNAVTLCGAQWCPACKALMLSFVEVINRCKNGRMAFQTVITDQTDPIWAEENKSPEHKEAREHIFARCMVPRFFPSLLITDSKGNMSMHAIVDDIRSDPDKLYEFIKSHCEPGALERAEEFSGGMDGGRSLSKLLWPTPALGRGSVTIDVTMDGETHSIKGKLQKKGKKLLVELPLAEKSDKKGTSLTRELLKETMRMLENIKKQDEKKKEEIEELMLIMPSKEPHEDVMADLLSHGFKVRFEPRVGSAGYLVRSW